MTENEQAADTGDVPEVDVGQATPAQDEGLEDLLLFIRDARGFDFTGYRTTLARRVRKRMLEVGIEDWYDYRDRLEIDANEFELLFNTILINVTSFFRDVEAWGHLQQEVLPDLIASAAPDHEFRIWSAGCASGEEAYSLAIVFAEALGIDEAVRRIKIYGTDVDEEALQEARSGTYSAKALDSVPAELRQKYFEPSGSDFVFRSDLRRRAIFGRHDLTRDAPISRLDLLVCRNTLMYFNVETQSEVLDRLNFALNDHGFLFLGKAEMLLSDGNRFDAHNIRQRIFRRRPGRLSSAHPPVQAWLDSGAGAESAGTTSTRRVKDRLLDAAPVPVVGVDADGLIVAANAQARTDFGLSASDIGRPFQDHELSYRPVELRSLLEQAATERRTVRLSAVERRVPGNSDPQFFDVVVQPLWGDDGAMAGTSIAFVDTTLQTRLQQEVKRVREDLETAYEELQSTNEELETTNEELQSSIEELETTNEELQSTNEELETTNEELESGNEELETMNEELRVRTGELDQTRTFLEGVLASFDAGVVVIDDDQLVQGWNRAAEEMWGLRAGEVIDQAFFQLDIGLPTAELLEAVRECIASRVGSGPIELAAVNRRGRGIVCSVTCSPLQGGTGGVVLIIDEVSRR